MISLDCVFFNEVVALLGCKGGCKSIVAYERCFPPIKPLKLYTPQKLGQKIMTLEVLICGWFEAK